MYPDDIDSTDDESPAEEAGGPIGGERLAEARRAKQITAIEIAKELHLDEPKVRALERNEFDVLGAPVFAKGHLRKYAELVDVDIDDVLADYYTINRSSPLPPVVAHSRTKQREFSPGPWLLGAAVIVVVLAAYWLLVLRPADSGSTPAAREPLPREQAQEQEPADTPDPAGNEDGAATEDELPQASPGAEPGAQIQTEEQAAEAETVSAAPVTRAPVAEPAEGSLRLSVTFAGDCWTEITDSAGRRLFFDLGRAGRTIDVSGEAPLSVLFGNAENVSLQVNGRDYVIRDADRRGQTARLTVRAP